MTRAPGRLRRFWRRDDGTATVEFVLTVPVLLMIFMASLESGLLMTRYISLERAVDMTVRNLRLGQYPNPTHDLLKREICGRSSVLVDCSNAIRIELVPVDTATWNLPTSRVGCVDRADEDIAPVIEVNPGQPNDLMLVRVCIVQDALFPTTGIGLRLPKDADGGYGLVALSSFANEP